MNNIEVLLLFRYTFLYITANKKTKDIVALINIVIFAVFIVLDIVNIFNHMFFYADNGVYKRAKLMILSQGYQFVAFAMVYFFTAFNKKLKVTEKVAFFVYCLLPFVRIVNIM